MEKQTIKCIDMTQYDMRCYFNICPTTWNQKLKSQKKVKLKSKNAQDMLTQKYR